MAMVLYNIPVYLTQIGQAIKMIENHSQVMSSLLIMVQYGPVFWSSHKQSTVSQSTLEAEYMALSDASRESMARSHLFLGIGLDRRRKYSLDQNGR